MSVSTKNSRLSEDETPDHLIRKFGLFWVYSGIKREAVFGSHINLQNQALKSIPVQFPYNRVEIWVRAYHEMQQQTLLTVDHMKEGVISRKRSRNENTEVKVHGTDA